MSIMLTIISSCLTEMTMGTRRIQYTIKINTNISSEWMITQMITDSDLLSASQDMMKVGSKWLDLVVAKSKMDMKTKGIMQRINHLINRLSNAWLNASASSKLKLESFATEVTEFDLFFLPSLAACARLDALSTGVMDW